jgi:hypothetical protein
MQGSEKTGEGPLSSEELEHDEQGGATLSQEQAAGHTIPESERDAAAAEGGAAGPRPISGTMLPPD